MKKHMQELNTQEISQVSGGAVVLLIPPALGFAAKVTGISLGMITSATITYMGLASAYRSIFPEGSQEK